MPSLPAMHTPYVENPFTLLIIVPAALAVESDTSCIHYPNLITIHFISISSRQQSINYIGALFPVSQGLNHGLSHAYHTFKRCRMATLCTGSRICTRRTERSSGSHPTSSYSSTSVHNTIFTATIQAVEPL